MEFANRYVRERLKIYIIHLIIHADFVEYAAGDFKFLYVLSTDNPLKKAVFLSFATLPNNWNNIAKLEGVAIDLYFFFMKILYNENLLHFFFIVKPLNEFLHTPFGVKSKLKGGTIINIFHKDSRNPRMHQWRRRNIFGFYLTTVKPKIITVYLIKVTKPLVILIDPYLTRKEFNWKHLT